MKRTTKKAVAAGAAGAAVLGAAAAAGYFYYASKNAKKHREAAARWASTLRRDVLREAKKLKDADRATWMRVIDGVADSYQKLRTIDPEDLGAAAGELKANWERLRADLGKPKGKGSRSAKTGTRGRKRQGGKASEGKRS
jgi:hypothetical protein